MRAARRAIWKSAGAELSKTFFMKHPHASSGASGPEPAAPVLPPAPPLPSALRTNVEGTKNVIAFAKRMKRPALIHTSTCFVAGNRSGEVWEGEELDGYFPRRKELTGTRFSVEQEVADNAAGAARIR